MSSKLLVARGLVVQAALSQPRPFELSSGCAAQPMNVADLI